MGYLGPSVGKKYLIKSKTFTLHELSIIYGVVVIFDCLGYQG